MKRFVAICAILAALSPASRARIGESLDQCIDRYGPLIEKRQPELPQSDPGAAVFSKNGVTIIIEFHGGGAWRITFRKPSFNATETEALLAANSASGTWSPPLRYGDREYRLCSDKQRLAVTRIASNNQVTQIDVILRAYSELLRANALSRSVQPEAGGATKQKANPLPGF